MLWYKLLPEVAVWGEDTYPCPSGWGRDALTFSIPELYCSRLALASTQAPTQLLPAAAGKIGNSRNEKSWGLGCRQGDHLPITVASKIDFKINSIYCLLLLPVLPHGMAAWTTFHNGGAPRGSSGGAVSTSRSCTRVCLHILKPPGTVLGNLSMIISFIQPPFNYTSPLSESQLCSLA